MEATQLQPLYVAPGAGEHLNILGGLVTYKATTQNTDGAFFVFEGRTEPGDGTPPHYHLYEDELFYVLEGTFRFVLGDQQVEAEAGAFLFAPRGAVHGFQNIGTTPGRTFVLVTPGNYTEQFFAAIGEPVVDPNNLPAPSGPPDIPAILAAAQRNGTVMLPPPGA